MNIFQRLESLKNWFDQNRSLFQSNLSRAKDEFDQHYKTEITRFSKRSKQLRIEKENSLQLLYAISYDDWVERQFQLMIQKISITQLDSDKNRLIQNFKEWLDTTSRIDYEFRVSSCEKEFADKIIENMNRHDRQITILKETYQNWKTNEEENFDQWLRSHPYYLELNELEYQYDAIADDADISHSNIQFHQTIKNKFPKKKTIPENWYRLQKIFDLKI